MRFCIVVSPRTECCSDALSIPQSSRSIDLWCAYRVNTALSHWFPTLLVLWLRCRRRRKTEAADKILPVILRYGLLCYVAKMSRSFELQWQQNVDEITCKDQ